MTLLCINLIINIYYLSAINNDINILYAVDRIDLEESALIEADKKEGFYTGIYFISFEDINFTIIVVRSVEALGMMWNAITPVDTKESIIDIQTGDIVRQNEALASELNLGELVHDASSVVIAGNWLMLENAYKKSEVDGDIGHYLERATLSVNDHLIGGTVRYSVGGSHWGESAYMIQLWDALTGHVVYKENDKGLNGYYIPSIEVCFSPDDERLYIATDRNRIFVFESTLPSAGMEDWELYNN